MRLRAIDLLRISLILVFGGIGIWLAISLFQGVTGWIILAAGFVLGFIGTELHYVPMLRERWSRIGVPGYEKTEEQAKVAKVKREKSGKEFNLAIIAGGIVFALWKIYLPALVQNITLIALWGGILASVLRVLRLIYQEGAKPGPRQ